MKRRVLTRFTDYVRCELPFDEADWPEIDDIEAVILQSPHYRALQDIGLPEDHIKHSGRKTPEDEVQWSVLATTNRIESRWVDRKVHECLGLKELEESMLKEIGPMKAGYSDAMTFMQKYYNKLTSSISNTLYYSKPVFTRDELEIMVPEVESPFFKRDHLINSYIQRMKRSKPDGHREAIKILSEN